MSNTETKTVTGAKTVTFVGDYFTITTTIFTENKLRRQNENDDDFTIRLAAEFLSEYYDFADLENKATISIDIIED